jgi:cellulose synthase/poly-beta-1,6-N-acetylglucosamine synthase-like glycosyltransferase
MQDSSKLKTQNSKLSIVVPAYNAANTVAGCIRALLDLCLSEPYEIILVDDGSTDNTAQIVESFGPGVCVLRQPHRGAAAARNAGVQMARGDIILFTDADCEPVREWAETLANAIRGGADGAKGTYRTRQRGVVARFVQAEYESKYRHMEKLEHIDFIDTYSAAYRRQALLDTGGFNEQLAVDEDQELSFRLAEAGKRLVYVPEAVVYHRHVTSPVDYFRRKFRIGYWKAFVGAMHPERMVSDSHTPQGMKLEIMLAGAGVASFLAAPFAKPARRACMMLGLGFAITTVPFAAKIAPKDPVVAAISPLMLLLRALGLGSGLLAGGLRLVTIHLHNSDTFQVE